jgi:hypothetical protein
MNRTVKVNEKVITTYTHHVLELTKLRLKICDMNDPGRKSIVITAIVFIDALSALVSTAMDILAELSC